MLLHLIKKDWRKIDQKIQYYQLDQQKLFNLIIDFMEIRLSKAKKYYNLWKKSKLPLKLKLHFDLFTLSSLKCSQILTNKDKNMRIAPLVSSWALVL